MRQHRQVKGVLLHRHQKHLEKLPNLASNRRRRGYSKSKRSCGKVVTSSCLYFVFVARNVLSICPPSFTVPARYKPYILSAIDALLKRLEGTLIRRVTFFSVFTFHFAYLQKSLEDFRDKLLCEESMRGRSLSSTILQPSDLLHCEQKTYETNYPPLPAIVGDSDIPIRGVLWQSSYQKLSLQLG